MYLEPNWRVLTIGDGDLSFSYSLLKHHAVSHVTASVLDSKSTLVKKYQENGITKLEKLNASIIFELDITKPDSWPASLFSMFDLVIFQFPLVPAAKNQAQYSERLNQNLANRNLLYRFISACFEYFLDKNGARLAYITSKEVKPYSHWQIETDLTQDSDIEYIGKQEFNYGLFPDYQIRNVDRDKRVKDTKGFIYAYSDIAQSQDRLQHFEPFAFLGQQFCSLCRVGPFTSEENKTRHMMSNKHKKLASYQSDWFAYLKQQES